MAKAKAKDGAAQGAAPVENTEMFDHIVTQEDLDANPDLVGAGVKVGETIQVPVKDEVIETPTYVQTILDSNAKVIESNEKVLAGLEAFKEHAVEYILAQSGESAPDRPMKEAKVRELDPNANYHVTAGNEFRDPNNFTIAYSEGDDVTHLGADKLSRLLNQGLVSPLPREED